MMNILDIQDKLKGLPDQFLAQELQNPSGQAPQYLVLSELKRRKEMRASSAGQQAPQQSMAEEAAAGVAALPVPPGMGPPARNAGAPMPQQQMPQMPPQGMYQGGVVRMAGGGDISTMSVEELQRLLSDLEDPRFKSRAAMPDADPAAVRELLQRRMDEQDATFRQRPRTPFGRDVDSAVNAVAGAAGTVGQGIANVGSAAAGAAGTVGRGLSNYFTESTPPTPPHLGDGEPPPGSFPTRAPPAPPPTPPPPAPPTPPPRGAAAGLGSLAGRSPVAAEAAAAMQPAPQQHEVDPIAGLRKQLEGYRADSAASRKDAQNMALMEAGLRIAGSQNPNFMGALADGAPAIGSYAKQIQDIKKGDRDNFQTEAYLERVGMDDRYRQGATALQREQMSESARHNRVMEARAGGAGRVPFSETLAREFMDPNTTPERRELIQEALGRGPKPQNPNLVGLHGNLRRELEDVEKALTSVVPKTPEYESLVARRKKLLQDSQSLYDRITGTNDPFGLRR